MNQDEFKPTVKLTPEQEAARNKRNGPLRLAWSPSWS